MIEAIIAAALAKIAEGSGAALVEAIRRRFQDREPTEVLESLDRVSEGQPSDEDTERLRAALSRYAAEDPELFSRLQELSTPSGATNVVTSSNVGKLIQAQNVGDVTM